jgi:hypothetical protein
LITLKRRLRRYLRLSDAEIVVRVAGDKQVETGASAEEAVFHSSTCPAGENRQAVLRD